MTTIEQTIMTSGLVVQLSQSQSRNFTLIKKQWQIFNQELKKYNLNQATLNWVKYGITFKIDDSYFYMTAIPKKNKIVPEHFTSLPILKGNYELFIHKGAMQNIKHTLYHIYKTVIPITNLQIEDHKKIGFIHFEKYDSRFRWNDLNSIIEVYLPLKNKLPIS